MTDQDRHAVKEDLTAQLRHAYMEQVRELEAECGRWEGRVADLLTGLRIATMALKIARNLIPDHAADAYKQVCDALDDPMLARALATSGSKEEAATGVPGCTCVRNGGGWDPTACSFHNPFATTARTPR